MADLINKLDIPWRIGLWTLFFVLVVVISFLLTRLIRVVFKKMRSRKEGIHLAFFERMVSLLVVVGFIVFSISLMGGMRSVWQTILGGTAIISAVIAFVAQDVIKDIIAGVMISTHKPFEIGDRIVLEDGTAGIVETMTMRQVVLIGIDSPRIVIPNSRINAMKLTNFSYHRSDRCVQFRFPVGYGSDTEFVKKIITDAVGQSDYSIPSGKDRDGIEYYGPVYFISIEESALMMMVTVHYNKNVPTERLIDDINTRVRNALNENGIEIPYNYLNVVSAD